MPLFKRACVVLFLISVSACSNSPSSPTSSVPVTVSPTLVITPPSVLDAGASVAFIVTAANLPAGNMTQTLVVSDGAGATETFVPAGNFATMTFIYPVAGAYTVTGTFTDAVGNTESASISVTVH